MTNPLLLELGKATATGVAAELLLESGKHLANQGFKVVTEGIDRVRLQVELQKKLSAVPTGQGMLVGFEVFTASDGKTYAYGPTPYGVGKRPEDPLVAIGFSRKAAAEYGQSIADSRDPAAGWERTGGRFYWVSRDQSGNFRTFAADEGQLLSRAFTAQSRFFSSAALAGQGTNLEKLAEQEKLFNEIEDQFREDLRSANMEGRLAGIRAKMRYADQQIRKAQREQKKALAEAKSAKDLQNVISLLGLAGSMTSFAASATAKADYKKTVVNNMTNTYNTNVQVYIQTIQQNTTINPGILPDSPDLIPLP